MTQDQFYTWLKDPSTMNAESISQLKEIVDRFPYFATAQMMLAKNLKQENHIDQQKQIQIAAVMVPNRALFRKYLLDQLPLIADRVTEPVLVETETKSEHQPEEVSQEENILSVVSASQDDEVTTTEEVEASMETVETKFPDELIPEPILYQIETAELPEAPPVIETEKPEPPELSFAEWLAYTEGKEFSGSDQIETKETIAETKESISNVELIDHFLSQQTEAPKKRAEFFNPHKNAAKSNAGDFTVVSETLANIYFEQEKYELAKQAYEALSLKYPEKSVYFAARLKAIHEILNSES